MSMCDNCIHDEVCGVEDNHEEAITFCANMIPKDLLDKIKAEIVEIENGIIKTTKCKDDMYYGTLNGFERALDIIDKHISEKEKE